MIDLLYKDFRLMFGTNKNISSRIIKILVRLIFIGSFIAIEVFLFTSILNKIKSFNNADNAFMTLFLFVISLLLIISGVFQARKLFFNERDIEQLSVHPVSNSAIIGSKLVLLFLIHYATCFMFVYPLFIAFASIVGKGSWFYYLGIFYPALSFLFEIGVALIFVYPLHVVLKFLKKHVVLKFIVTLTIYVLVVVLYSIVLNLFINFIAGGNINQLVSQSFINRLINLQKYEIPIKYLFDAFILRNYRSLIPYLFIGIGVFIVGAGIAIFAYNFVRNISYASKKKVIEKPLEVMKPTRALIKKELGLLTKNADYSTSFTSLLIVEPFLAFLVIKALNTIFMNGAFAYYSMAVPEFINIVDTIIVMFFTVMIAQGSSVYISMEKKTIKVMKVMPIPFGKQLTIKVAIPFILSVIALLVTTFVLKIFGMINWFTLLMMIVLSILLLLVFSLVSLKEELSIKHKRPKNTIFSSFISYLLPVIFAAISFFLNFKGISLGICFLSSIGIFILITIPIFFYIKGNLNSLFLDLDMVN